MHSRNRPFYNDREDEKMNICEAVNNYRAAAQMLHFKQKTDIEWVLDELAAQFPDLDVRKFTPAKLHRFTQSLEEHYWQANGQIMPEADQIKIAKALHAFFDWIYIELAIRYQRFEDNGKFYTDPLPPPFSAEEKAALLKACQADPRGSLQDFNDQSFILVLLDSGLWISNLCQLRLMDVKPDKGEIHIFRRGKKVQVIPMGRASRRSISRYLFKRGDAKPDESMFLSKSGSGITPGKAYKLVQRVGKKAGISDLNPIRFRVTYAVENMHDEEALSHLKQHLGYISLFEVLIALTFSSVSLAEIHRKASPVDNWRL
jgi:site-specific recombinase XerD